ncbi:MAG TPA: tRNA adenosine(34) deaminase TadA [Cellvibrionaceae bacterium]
MPRDDWHWMARARQLADEAAALGEVPVGAVIVLNDEVIGEGFNCPISGSDPTAHAEIMALREAARQLGNYRLPGATLYVTLEPCTMCVGALIHARIARLVYGTSEPKAGAVVSQAQLPEAPYFNHRLQVTGGIDAEACQLQLSGFFQMRRALRKKERDG